MIENDMNDDEFQAFEDILKEQEEIPLKKTKKKTRKQVQLDDLNAIEWWKRCLSDPIGRREIWKIINDRCRAFNTTFAVGPSGFPQIEASWFHAGEKSVGLDMYHRIMALCPKEIILMHQENDFRFSDK